MRARRDHRQARSGHAVLYAVARPGPRYRAEPAGVRLSCRRADGHVGAFGPGGRGKRVDRSTPRLANTAEISMKNIALAERPMSFDVNAVRRQFPVLARMVHGKP